MQPTELQWQGSIGAAAGMRPAGLAVLQAQCLPAVHWAPTCSVGHGPLAHCRAVILQWKKKKKSRKSMRFLALGANATRGCSVM